MPLVYVNFVFLSLQCSLTESHLSDVLTVSLDHTGSVIAVSMSTSPAICEGRYVSHHDLQHFNTTVFIKHMEQGPMYVLLVLSYFWCMHLKIK